MRLADVLERGGTNYHRAAHPPWNLIANIIRETTKRLAVGVMPDA